MDRRGSRRTRAAIGITAAALGALLLLASVAANFVPLGLFSLLVMVGGVVLALTTPQVPARPRQPALTAHVDTPLGHPVVGWAHEREGDDDMTTQVAPGWYPVREGKQLRYWDGSDWTDTTHDTPQPEPTVSTADPGHQPPGWYPISRYEQRYWDGEAWTDGTSPYVPPPPERSRTWKAAEAINSLGWLAVLGGALVVMLGGPIWPAVVAALVALPLGVAAFIVALVGAGKGEGGRAAWEIVSALGLIGLPLVLMAFGATLA